MPEPPTLLRKSPAQVRRDLEERLLLQEYELSAAAVQKQHWQHKASLLQLRVTSLREDAEHLQLHNDILRAELDGQACYARPFADRKQLTSRLPIKAL